MRLKPAELEERVTSLLRHAGVEPEESVRVARSLVLANMSGHDSHGVVRVPRYLAWMQDGTIRPGTHVAVLGDGGAWLLLDGQHGFGQTIGPESTELGIARAREHGVAITALRRAAHLGRIGEYAEMAAAQGLVSIHCVNVSKSVLVAPFGAREKRFSTSPFCIGVPRPKKQPLILDFASSLVAEGKALNAFKGGKPLPPDTIISADGRITNDPEDFYGTDDHSLTPAAVNSTGALRAMGLHKGSGLSFMMEILAGALTGNGTSGPDAGWLANGMLSIFLDPERFDPENAMHAQIDEFVDWVKSARTIEPEDEVLVPGEPEQQRREERARDGIEVPEEVWAALQREAERLGCA